MNNIPIKDAYVFGVPLVLMDLTRRRMLDANNPHHGFINTFSHLSSFPDASFRMVVRPNEDKESNWLPAPSGDFNLLLRIYWPGKEVIDGRWVPPPVKKT